MRFIIKVIFITLIGTIYSVVAEPAKDSWAVWQKHKSGAKSVINNSRYQQFLAKYVTTATNGVNLVDYYHVSQSDQKFLEDYISYLATLKIDNYNRNEQLAYWINLHNALVIDVVLKHLPVDSIRNIKLGGLFSNGPWDAKLVKVEGRSISLNDIEQRIIRPIWNDPRTHYALNCASYSCPNLGIHPYTGKNINKELNTAAIAYINSPSGVSVENDKLIISQLYEWYQSDFGKNELDVINHLSKYANPQLKVKLQGFKHINSYTYNWQLNAKLQSR